MDDLLAEHCQSSSVKLSREYTGLRQYFEVVSDDETDYSYEDYLKEKEYFDQIKQRYANRATLENAMKFTDEGYIKFGYTQKNEKTCQLC